MTYVYENNSEGDVLVYKKPKNRSKNYPKPKKPRKILITTEKRFWSQPKTEYKTIITEDLYSWIFKTLL